MALPITLAHADDHKLFREGVINILRGNDAFKLIIQAKNGLELVQLLKASPDLPDIAILDISMPVMDGFETLSEIRCLWPKMRTLILSTFESDYYVMKMIMRGANGYLLKDCAPEEFTNALQTIYEKGIYYSSVMGQKLFQAMQKHEVSLPEITDREADFLKFCCSDLSYKEIAKAMFISIKSVDWYRSCLFKKFETSNRSGLVICAIALGIVPAPTSKSDWKH